MLGDSSRKLMLATGKAMVNYEPLVKYLELADPEQRERALPKGSDIEFVRALAERGYRTLDNILDEVAQIVKCRLDPKLSQVALKLSLGIELEADEAVRYISRILAGWIIEIAEQLGVIKLRRMW